MSGHKRLQEHCQQLQEALNDVPQPPITNLRNEEGSVTCRLQGHDRLGDLTLVYPDVESYPNCSVLVISQDARTSELLEPLGERFMDKAPLAAVLQQVCKIIASDTTFFSLSGLSDGSGAGESAKASFECYDTKSNCGDGSGDGSSCYDEDDGDGEDWALAEVEDDETLVNTMTEYGRWEKHEEMVRVQQEQEEDDAVLDVEERAALKQQIFDTREAFKMLSKELLEILKGGIPNCVANAVESDVYIWHIWLTGFLDGSALGEDMRELEKRCGSSSVQLELKFKRGLYPFFPPSVELLGPRFRNCLHFGCSGHPAIAFGSWDPCTTIRSVITTIKDFIQAYGRVDVDSSSNMRYYSGQGDAYAPLERALCRLEPLARVTPLWAHEFREMYHDRQVALPADAFPGDISMELEPMGVVSGALPDNAAADAASPVQQTKRQRAAEDKHYWAKGTGYGSDVLKNDEAVWDARSSERAQAARDVEIVKLLNIMIQEAAALDMPPGWEEDGPSSSASREEAAGHVRSCVAAMQHSCLVPFLLRELAHASFTDMAARQQYYMSLLALIEVLCRPATHNVIQLACSAPAQEAAGGASCSSLLMALDQLAQQAHIFLRACSQLSKARDGSHGTTVSTAGPASPSPAAPEPAVAHQAGSRSEAPYVLCRGSNGQCSNSSSSEESMNYELAHKICQLRGMVSDIAASSGAGDAGGSSHDAALESRAANMSLDEQYVEALKPYQVEFVSDLDQHHRFRDAASKESLKASTRVSRVSKELAALKADLPLCRSSSIFVRISEDNMMLWRACIIGPDNTPYAGGAFMFDIYFPPQYPSTPPQVNLCTTGGGRVRFNPNLYNCGKVCLSLLGTWRGATAESWNSLHSTVLQVLVSIQSLILVDEPYFNEPGYERNMSSVSAQASSRQYNKDVRLNCMRYAMLEHIKKPPQEFKEVIENHFRLQRDRILAWCREWADEAQRAGDSSGISLVNELEALLPPSAEEAQAAGGERGVAGMAQ